MFAGHETVTKTVSFYIYTDIRLQSIVTDSVVDIRILGIRQEPPRSGKTSGGNRGNPGEDQGQG